MSRVIFVKFNSIKRGDSNMFLPTIFNLDNKDLKEIQINELLQTNEESEKFNLTLTEKDAKEIIQVRECALQSYGRIEIDMEVTKKLLKRFSCSTFIKPQEYVATINSLQELFYYMKNETEDRIGDDKLIGIMEDFYNNSCGGSISILRQRIEVFSNNFRRENQKKDYLLEGNYFDDYK